jgi:HK97 family phage portal protein
MSSYASTEQFFLSFIPHCIGPYLKRIEKRINYTLIPPEDQPTVFFEFLVESLLRGDLLTRYKAYMLGRQGGWLSPNDIRRKENLNPREDEGGDDYSNPNINVDVNKIKDDNKPSSKGEED